MPSSLPDVSNDDDDDRKTTTAITTTTTSSLLLLPTPPAAALLLIPILPGAGEEAAAAARHAHYFFLLPARSVVVASVVPSSLFLILSRCRRCWCRRGPPPALPTRSCAVPTDGLRLLSPMRPCCARCLPHRCPPASGRSEAGGPGGLRRIRRLDDFRPAGSWPKDLSEVAPESPVVRVAADPVDLFEILWGDQRHEVGSLAAPARLAAATELSDCATEDAQEAPPPHRRVIPAHTGTGACACSPLAMRMPDRFSAPPPARPPARLFPRRLLLPRPRPVLRSPLEELVSEVLPFEALICGHPAVDERQVVAQESANQKRGETNESRLWARSEADCRVRESEGDTARQRERPREFWKKKVAGMALGSQTHTTCQTAYECNSVRGRKDVATGVARDC